MTTLHLGDHTTDCETCKLNCDCQDCRIQNNLKDYFEAPLDYSLFDFEDIFEDRDPAEFI